MHLMSTLLINPELIILWFYRLEPAAAVQQPISASSKSSKDGTGTQTYQSSPVVYFLSWFPSCQMPPACPDLSHSVLTDLNWSMCIRNRFSYSFQPLFKGPHAKGCSSTCLFIAVHWLTWLQLGKINSLEMNWLLCCVNYQLLPFSIERRRFFLALNLLHQGRCFPSPVLFASSLSCYLRQLPFCLSNGISVVPSCVCGSEEVWRKNSPHSLMSLNTWAPAGDAVSGGYATFRSWSLANRSASMWANFDVL